MAKNIGLKYGISHTSQTKRLNLWKFHRHQVKEKHDPKAEKQQGVLFAFEQYIVQAWGE